MIGVAVREQDRVDARDAVRQRLLPEVGRGVDEDRRVAGHVDVDRRPQPLVARIGRRHTSQSQPIIGTPGEVPVPRKVTRAAGDAGDLAIPKADIVTNEAVTLPCSP